MPEHPAAFLDRDGVINEDRAYVHRIEDFHFLHGALEGCRRLAAAGYLLVIITNQAGIARGYYGVAEFEALTAWMSERFAAAGAPLSGVYYCPHHPDATIEPLRLACACRKPAPGLLLRAQRELHIDMSRSILVGDKTSDIEAGRSAGVGRCVLLQASRTAGAPVQHTADADVVVSDLLQLADLVTR